MLALKLKQRALKPKRRDSDDHQKPRHCAGFFWGLTQEWLRLGFTGLLVSQASLAGCLV